MSITSQNWGMIHPSALQHAAAFMRPATAMPRPSGAVRYCCPITGSFVLVTDEATLHSLDRPRVRLRCADCGEVHLMTRDDSEAIVATPAKP